MKDAIVVGCGIIGSTLSEVLTTQGLNVLTLDCKEKLSGTKPSGGHLKPSWFGGLKKDVYEPAMETLDSVWGLKEEKFMEYPKQVLTTVWRVDTDIVTSYPSTYGKVTHITQQEQYPIVTYLDSNGKHIEERGRLLVVCAGYWTQELIPELKMSGKMGVSFRVKGNLSTGFLQPWAPYKQIVAHQQGENEIWVGDGSAIIPKNWSTDKVTQSRDRCLDRLQMSQVLKTYEGIRPYGKTGTDPCLMKKVGPSTWVITGSGKSGTIAAGWSSNIIKETL